MRRTALFLPGNNPNMLINGGYLGADSIIFDLEDAVSPDEKDAARILIRHALSSLKFEKCEIIVRINSLDTSFWEKDVEEIVPLGPDALMPTKVSDPGCIHKLAAKMDEAEKRGGSTKRVMLIPLIETALGLENSFAIASCHERIAALLLGAEDLTADLRAPRTREGGEIAYARNRLVCAARAAGVDALDTPFPLIDDMEGLRQDALLAKSFGFSGKAVISPRHVNCVNGIFSPSDAEIEYAHQVFEAIETAKKQGKGAISLGGKMIDAPIVERARKVLETAKELQGGRT
ncbi:MAG: CoA ester lyase [Spirochaetia bacterium]|jgi:citrate lyase subunit beta/citryl-CoA lyase|nr:CoA ester lyase [Spirochaetia bacterium]